MKQFAKTRLLPFLLVAITALCALFGVILTTPNTVKADASTLPYDKELGFEVKEGDKLFGKYVAVFASGSDYSTVIVNNGDWEFFVNDEGQSSITVFSSEGGSDINDGRVVFEVDVLSDTEEYYAIFDFTKEYTFSVDCGNGPIEITLNEETLVVTEIISSASCCPLMYYPKTTYSNKTMEKGDSLANKAIIVPYSENYEGWWWSINLTDYSIYFDDTDAGVYFTIVGEDEELLQFDIIPDLGCDFICRIDNGIYVDYIMIKMPETLSYGESGVTYESSLIVASTLTDGFENNFRILEFIDGEQPSDTPTDGEQPKDDNGKTPFLEGVANWFENAGNTVSDWLAEYNIEVSGRGVLVGAVIIAIVITLIKRGRRRK